MEGIPTFWQAFETSARIVFAILGWCIPWIAIPSAVMAVLERHRLSKWWGRK